MPSLAVLGVLLRELTTLERAPRVPEPSLVMDDPQNVDAYARAAVEDRVLAPVYLYNAAHISEVIRPGDRVLDLGCGPATQLEVAAALNPEVDFVGVDLSEPMLERGRAILAQQGLTNVELTHGDITRLEFDDRSFDAVVSTLTFHHLPDERALGASLQEVARVVKPGGGLFLLDLGRLRSTRSIHYFAHQYADRQSELFTLDYWNSLRAAFSPRDFRAACAPLEGRGRLYQTFGAPYMLAFKSPRRRAETAELRGRFRAEVAKLPSHHQTDLRDLSVFFALGGLRTGLL